MNRTPRSHTLPRPASRFVSALTVFLVTPLGLPAQNQTREKPVLSLRNIGATGIFAPAPEEFTWLPDGSGFYFADRGAYWRFDAKKREKTRLFSVGRIQALLMKERSARTPRVMDDTNATGRFDRSAVSFSNDRTKFLGFLDNDIFVYDLATRKARFLTDDPAPEAFQVFSPDDQRVAYVKNNDVWMLTLDDGTETKLTDNRGENEVWNGVPDWVYEEELTIRRAFWWSPDSRRIAYLQFDTRPIRTFPIIDHLRVKPEPERQKFPLTGTPNSIVKLGVVDLAGKTTWVDTGEDQDVYLFRVRWTKTGREFSYQWMNRKQNRLELRFASPVSGRSRTAVVEESDTWINTTALSPFTNLMFLADDSFVWGSERTGFRHLYHYDIRGQLRATLTSGSWQIEDIDGVSADGKTVYYTSTAVSPLERHLYSVGIDGSGGKRLTQPAGTHVSEVGPEARYIVTTHSSITTQPLVRVLDGKGGQVALLNDNTNPRLGNFDFNFSKLGSIKSKDGETLYTLTTHPPGFDAKRKYPVIVYCYGGPAVQLVTNKWDLQMMFMHQLHAARGYVVFTIDNRGSWGRGHAFEASIHRKLGTVEWQDQVEGVEHLKTLPYIDGERVGIVGASYGGSMVLYCLLRAPDTFHVGVSMYPGVDWRHYDTIYTERYMGTPEDNPEGYAVANVAKYARNLRGKLYLYAGLMDNNVHVQQVFQMVDALIKAGKDFKFMLYPQERHGVRDPARQMHSMRTTDEFLDTHLQPSGRGN